MKRLTGLALAGTGVVLALTACRMQSTPQANPVPSASHSALSSERADKQTDANPAHTPAASSTKQVNPASTATTAAVSLAAAPRRSETASACPVTVDTLLAALKASDTNIYARAGKPAALEAATCYSTFAVARTVSDGTIQSSRILFSFDNASATWRPLNLGSTRYCTPDVPADVAAHLPSCA